MFVFMCVGVELGRWSLGILIALRVYEAKLLQDARILSPPHPSHPRMTRIKHYARCPTLRIGGGRWIGE